MPSSPEQVPEGKDADTQWRALGPRRRLQLMVAGEEPATPEEAVVALGFARRRLKRNELYALVGALTAFVASLAVSLAMEGGLTGDSLIGAGGISVGVGLGIEVAGHIAGKRLASRARRVLSRSD